MSHHLSPGVPAMVPKCHLVVVKVASRCNLNCSYCYVYNAGDLSYLNQPVFMSDETADALIRRVRDHCCRHELSDFTFVFHGGEPLLARPRFFRRLVARANSQIPSTTHLHFCLQSNGTLLTKDWCSLLAELNIGLGISLDGPKRLNDVHRVDHSGKGSYDRVRAGWEVARSCGLRPGLLAVINLEADPLEVYDHAKELNPSSIDFLFPDGTHDKLPPHYSWSGTATPYADWLMKIFAAWTAEEKSPFRVRIFGYLIRRILGGNDRFDNFSTEPNEVMVIETNGAIESLDVLKVCKAGITQSDANVHSHDLDQALDSEMVRLYYASGEQVCATCQKCIIKSVCAGGYLPHRYRNDTGFDNPSVYCRDLMKLITEIQNWVISELPEGILANTDLTPITYAEARTHIMGLQ
jgi:uncharacterized protein